MTQFDWGDNSEMEFVEVSRFSLPLENDLRVGQLVEENGDIRLQVLFGKKLIKHLGIEFGEFAKVEYMFTGEKETSNIIALRTLENMKKTRERGVVSIHEHKNYHACFSHFRKEFADKYILSDRERKPFGRTKIENYSWDATNKVLCLEIPTKTEPLKTGRSY
jgi:hypothetical protein